MPVWVRAGVFGLINLALSRAECAARRFDWWHCVQRGEAAARMVLTEHVLEQCVKVSVHTVSSKVIIQLPGMQGPAQAGPLVLYKKQHGRFFPGEPIDRAQLGRAGPLPAGVLGAR